MYLGNRPTSTTRALLILLACSTAQAAPVAWDGGGDGSTWGDADNWDGNVLPGPADDVTISVAAVITVTHSSGTTEINSLNCDEALVISGGSMTIANASTINSPLTLSASGMFTGAGDLTLTGLFTWNSGTMGGSGTTFANGGISLMTAGTKTLSRDMENSGTATWSAGQIRINDPARFTNLPGALFDAQDVTNMTWSIAKGTFDNQGTFQKSSGAGTLTVGLTFDNQSNAELQTGAGTLTFSGGGTNTGHIDAAVGTELRFNADYTHDLSGQLTGQGALFFTSGMHSISGVMDTDREININTTVNLNANYTFLGTVNVTSTLSGSGDLVFNDTLNWTTGTMSGTGTCTIALGGTLNLTTAGTKTLNRNLNNGDTTTWSGGQLRINAPASFTNVAGALFDAQDVTNLTWSVAKGTFDNQGTFQKSSGAGTLTVGLTFDNQSNAELQTGAGTLTFSGGGTNTGQIDAAVGTELRFNADYTHDLSGQLTGQGALFFTSGTHSISGVMDTDREININTTVNLNANYTFLGTVNVTSTLSGSGDLVFNDTLNWTTGTMSGTGTSSIAVGGALNLPTTGTKTLNRNLNNAGTTTWPGGQLRVNAPASFTNLPGALFDAQDVTNLTWSVVKGTFDNQGTFQKSSGAGTLTVGLTFDNQSNAELQTGAGTLTFSGGGTNTGQIDAAVGTELRFNADYTHDLSGQLTGQGALFFTSGTHSISGVMDTDREININAAVNLNANYTFLGTVNVTSTLSGSGDLVFNDTLNWTTGTMSGTGTSTVAVGGALNMTTAGTKTLNRNLTNADTTTWSGGQLRVNDPATVTNLPGALFDAQDVTTLTWSIVQGTFDNQGTFRKSTGAGTLSISVIVDNSDLIEIQSGTVQLSGTMDSHTGNVTGAGTLVLNAGTHTFETSSNVTVAEAQFAGGTTEFHGTYSPTATATSVTGGTHTFHPDSTVTTVGDTLTVTGGIVDFSSGDPISVTTYNQSSGTLLGDSDVTVSGLLTFSGGTIGGTGKTFANGGLVMDTGSTKTQNRSLDNAVLATWSGGQLRINDPGVFTNLVGATFDAQDVTSLAWTTAQGTFENQGVFQKSAGAGTLTLGTDFNNDNLIDVQIGTLRFSGGTDTHTGDVTGTGTLALNSGTHTFDTSSSVSVAEVAFTSGVTDFHGTFASTGTTTTVSGGTHTFHPDSTVTTVGDTLTVTGGTVDFSSGDPISVTTYNQSSGTLLGDSDVTVSGLLTFSGGTMGGTGKTFANGGLVMDTGSTKTQNRRLDNAVLATWSGGQLRINDPGVFTNLVGATFDAQDVTSLAWTTAQGTFENQGVFQKSAGAGTLTLGTDFNNDNLIDVQIGTLRFSGGTDTHTGDVTGTGTLALNSGTHTFDTSSSVSVAEVAFTSGVTDFHGTFASTGTTTTVSGGTHTFHPDSTITSVGSTLTILGGTVDFSSGDALSVTTYSHSTGSLVGSSDLTVAGTMTFAGGTIGGMGTTFANGGLAINTGSAKTLSRNLENSAAAVWSAGQLRVNSPATLINLPGASFDIEDVTSLTWTTARGTLDNQGMLLKSSGAGTTIFSVNVLNSGTVEAQSGTMQFNATYSQSAGTTSLVGGVIATNASAALELLGGVLDGEGLIDGDINNVAGQVSVGMSPGIINIAGDYTQGPAGLFTVEIGGFGPGADHDQLNVLGTATLDGTLEIILIGGFVPILSDSFEVLTYGSRVGFFCNFIGLAIPGGLFFDRVYNPNEMLLEAVAFPTLLDCNANGIADECDLFSGSSTDCNTNGIPDDCDISSGASSDCNTNGIPDECEIGACCFSPTACGDVALPICLAGGGLFRGPCASCPTQNVAVFPEPGGGIFVHVIGAPVACPPPPGPLEKIAQACPPEKILIDPWESPIDGQMCHNFGVAGSPAIPADFFAPGSDAFAESVCLEGIPLGMTPFGLFGSADTLIARTQDPFAECDLPSTTEVTIDLEVVELNLHSIDPITVLVNGQPEDWNVSVDLSTVTPPPGTLSVTKSHCNGGTYTSVLNVQPRFTFVKLLDPGEVRVLDTGLEGISPVVLTQDSAAPWVSTIDPNLGVAADACSFFHAGIEESSPTTDCDCNSNQTHDLCESIDCNSNLVPDDCDINSGSSDDKNSNGIPDECEGACCLGDGSCAPGESQSTCSAQEGIFQGLTAPCAGAACEAFGGCCLPNDSCVTLQSESVCTAASGDYLGDASDCDVCCQVPAAPIPDSISAKNRYLTFSGGDAGRSQAVRVTFDDLPPPHDVLNGLELWVGQPQDVSELGCCNDATPPTFKAARLECDPVFLDWSTLGMVSTFHEGIAPGGTYTIQVIDSICDETAEASFSAPLELTLSRWGDIAGSFDSGSSLWTAPDGIVSVPFDLLALIDAFSGRAGAPSKARADLSPAEPDLIIGVTDLTRDIDAFQGATFPFTAPAIPCSD